ncbi:MAG TPA: NADH-quinone oxidoreductase subunit N [Candidatus Binatia bacterium]|jgi:NADH-quinone oxidoreductase subunit N|nr:NADH-quinone oxidoreductase subunit N [Candidatus Binatia bacterium]
MDLGNLESLKFFYPEAILSGTILLIILLDLVLRSKKGLALLAIAGSLLSLWATFDLYGTTPGYLFHRMIILDNFSLFFKVVSLLAALLVVWMSLGCREIREIQQGEYYTILLTSALGMFFMASSSNLLMAYLSLELVSITSYILTGFLPHNRRSTEAALKYLIYGGVASGTMIYGMSWVFGMTGTLDYAGISTALFQGQPNRLSLFMAFVFILAGFGYKIVFVPFHMWSPDVYQGAPTPVTAFLSVGSNAAGTAILMRFFFPAVSRLADGGDWLFISGVEWPHFLLIVSMVTMTLGNLCALNQQNLKRLLAYSGIAHAGYILMGLVVLNNDGLKAVLFYVVVYLIMNLGAFLVVVMVANETGKEEIGAYRGLAWRGAAIPAVCMAIFLFSLTGLPPLAGFIGKFFLFAAVIKEGFYLLAVVAIINTVISLYYYAGIVKTMFLDFPEPTDQPVAMTANNSLLLGVLSALTVLFGLYWGPLVQYTNQSLRFFIK